MNPNLTEIAFILDRSGSMQGMVEPAIAGFNLLLAAQKTAPGEARFTLVLFDNEYLVPVNSVPIAEVPELTTATFVPRGSTALLDAIGRTIDSLGKKLDATPEPERPAKVIVAILTDGEENASTGYSAAKIADMIRHQTETYQWEFLFLGANQDAIATAAKFGIDHHNAASYKADAGGCDAALHAISDRIADRRKTPVPGAPEVPSLREAYRRRSSRSARNTP